jgi:hypothetical protein
LPVAAAIARWNEMSKLSPPPPASAAALKMSAASEILGSPALGRVAGGDRLDHVADFEGAKVAGKIGRRHEARHVRGRRVDEIGARTAPRLDQPIGLEPHEGLAHDRPRGAEGLAQGVLGRQLLAADQYALHDLFEQLPVKDVSQPPVRSGLNLDIGHGLPLVVTNAGGLSVRPRHRRPSPAGRLAGTSECIAWPIPVRQKLPHLLLEKLTTLPDEASSLAIPAPARFRAPLPDTDRTRRRPAPV